MNKIKKTFLLLVFAATFVFFANSLFVFYGHAMKWGNLLITDGQFMNQVLWLVLKLVPTFITVAIAKHYWY